ncbi:hypothetical protein [Methylobrevis albus]|uniref:Uncharacterized protein n=1 Tax=Methylobrevis albus TaxID=2793297 RepID=A0A931HZ26_9HYPH|nr:hypothetical protein [Methylobrevis albus]MBH0236344.1 hypothetical protein [Methylobrevis albus]
MSRTRLTIAIAAALFFAIPFVTFISMMVVFPILFYGLIAAVANFGPPLLLAAFGLAHAGWRVKAQGLYETWQVCSILWVGCAFGIAHWGDVAASMGARNTPFLEVLFAPWLLLLGYEVG